MKKIVIIFIGLFLLINTAYSQNKTITAVADPWAPFVDPDNPLGGLSLEVIRAAYETQGYSVTMEYMPWARAMQGVTNGTYDILPDIWFSEERAKVFLISDSYASNSIKFISNIEDSFNYTGLDSLKGKIIGTMRGYSYSQEFMDADNFTKDLGDNLINNILKLDKKRIDLVIEDEIVSKAIINKEKPELLDTLYFSDKSLLENKLYIATSRDNPRSNEIINTFNKGLNEIKNNGKYDSIMKQYGIKAIE